MKVSDVELKTKLLGAAFHENESGGQRSIAPFGFVTRKLSLFLCRGILYLWKQYLKIENISQTYLEERGKKEIFKYCI